MTNKLLLEVLNEQLHALELRAEQVRGALEAIEASPQATLYVKCPRDDGHLVLKDTGVARVAIKDTAEELLSNIEAHMAKLEEAIRVGEEAAQKVLDG